MALKREVKLFMLSERKKKILQAVIDENIKSAEPISSKDLQEKYFDSVSSATIRNELMGLEELGYLSHTHTSSGRVPTKTGFKKYIEELMPEKQLTRAEIEKLQENFNEKIDGIEDLVATTARSISEATTLASVVYMGVTAEASIEGVKLVKITDDSCLAIIVTDLGVIRDIVIEIPPNVSDEDCVTAGKILSESMSGRTIKDLQDEESVAIGVSQSVDNYRMFFDLLIKALKEREEKPIVRYGGASNLLSQPEYKSIEKAQRAMTIFENKEILAPLLESGNDLEISISVGTNENEDCSIVSATYKINGKSIGKAGVIGPVRMDYAKAVSVLREINQTIENNVEFVGLKPKNKKAFKNQRYLNSTNKHTFGKKGE